MWWSSGGTLKLPSLGHLEVGEFDDRRQILLLQNVVYDLEMYREALIEWVVSPLGSWYLQEEQTSTCYLREEQTSTISGPIAPDDAERILNELGIAQLDRFLFAGAAVELYKIEGKISHARERLQLLTSLILTVLRRAKVPTFLKDLFGIERHWFVCNLNHPPRGFAAGLTGISVARANLLPSAS